MSLEVHLDKPEQVDLGTTLSGETVRKGLRELNPDIHFDLATRRNMNHPMQGHLNGVGYRNQHICTMDRGVIPEFAVWDRQWGHQFIDMADIERYNDTQVIYMQILPTDARYHEALLAAEKGDDEYKLDGDKLFLYRAFRYGWMKRRIIRAGWRHTFSRLIAAGIPGVTKTSLERKFRVDLDKYLGRPIPDVIVESMG